MQRRVYSYKRHAGESLSRISYLGYRHLFGVITEEEEQERLTARQNILDALERLPELDRKTAEQIAEAAVAYFEAQHVKLRLLDLECRLGLTSEQALLRAYEDAAYLGGRAASAVLLPRSFLTHGPGPSFLADAAKVCLALSVDQRVGSLYASLFSDNEGYRSMSTPKERLNELGLKLPAPTKVPEGLHLPFSFVNVRGERVIFSGHPKNAADGSIAGPFGVLGKDFSTEQGYAEAREVALTVLANIEAEIGDLTRIVGWTRVFGMVTSAPGYTEQHLVVNGFSDLIIEVFGSTIGRHARSAIGVPGLPLGFAMEIEGEVLISP